MNLHFKFFNFDENCVCRIFFNWLGRGLPHLGHAALPPIQKVMDMRELTLKIIFQTWFLIFLIMNLKIRTCIMIVNDELLQFENTKMEIIIQYGNQDDIVQSRGFQIEFSQCNLQITSVSSFRNCLKDNLILKRRFS